MGRATAECFAPDWCMMGWDADNLEVGLTRPFLLKGALPTQVPSVSGFDIALHFPKGLVPMEVPQPVKAYES